MQVRAGPSGYPMGIAPAVRLLVVALALLAAPAAPATAQDGGGTAVSVELTGTIDPATAAWVQESLDEARAEGAQLVILRLDTPGGLDASMREIVQSILAGPVPVVVHVTPSGARAASAGLFVTQAADVAAMSPGTNIGAATPVSLGGGETDDVLGRKIRNDAVAYVRALAQTRGRNADLAARMVTDAVSVSAARARDAGLVDVVASDQAALLEALDGFEVQGPRAGTLETSGISVERRDMPWHVEARQLLVNPSIAYLLLLGGMLLIAFEVLSPGLIGPGLFGAVALALGLYGTAQLPVTVVGVALLLGGLAALVAETQTGSGVLGVAGAVALVAAGLLLYDTDSEALAVSVPAAVAAGVLLGAIVVFAAGKGVSTRRIPPRGESADLVGRTASVRSPLEPLGQVFVAGALWRARAVDEGSVPAGRTVVVERVEGLTLFVRPAGDSPEPPPKEAP